MKAIYSRLAFIFLLMNFSFPVLAQQPEKPGWVRGTITLEKLKSAKTIDEIIVNFPEGYEVVHYNLSMAAKDQQKKLENWRPDNVKNDLNNTFQIVEVGWRVGIEFIEVKRKGTDSKPVHLQPQDLLIIE